MPNPTNTNPVSKPVAAPTKPTTPATPAPTIPKTVLTFNKEALQERLEKIITYQKSFSGKVNHNPYFWIRDRVTPLYNRLVGINSEGKVVDPEVSQALNDAIMALPLEEPPIINKNLK